MTFSPGSFEINSSGANLRLIRATNRLLGRPLELTPEALDQAAEVTPVDVAVARSLWQQYAPSPLVLLLDAAPEEGGT